jgi:hypothetical protein
MLYYLEHEKSLNNSTTLENYKINYDVKINESIKTFTMELCISSTDDNKCYIWDLSTNQTSYRTFDDFLMNPNVIDFHPFERINIEDIKLINDPLLKGDKKLKIGGINAKNIVMDSLFRMIMMNDEEFEKNSGNLSNYRSRLIKILYDLWD